MKISKLLISSLLILSMNVIYAQDDISNENSEESSEESSSGGGEDKNLGAVFNGASISVSVGMNTYFGDLAEYSVFPRPKQFGDYVTGAFKASIARDIKWGLGAQFNYQVGSLKGTRKTGKNSATVSFENNFFDLSFQMRYLLNDALFKKSEYNRFKLYAHVGVGSTWYRAKLYDTQTLDTRDFEGFIEVEETSGSSLKTLSDKAEKAQTWTIPYGVSLAYKLNYKTDIHLDFTQTAAKTDRLDAFGRSSSSRDKYDYVGIGLTFNFNRTEAEDSPKKKPKKNKNDAYDNGKDTNNSNSSSSSRNSNSGDIRKGIFSRNRNKNNNTNNNRNRGDDDELLNIRLKLFETQLKLFEMQYLLGK